MDIAELRKKAKQAELAKDNPGRQESTPTAQEPLSGLPAETPDEFSSDVPADRPSQQVAEEWAMEGLDKLFSMESSLDLATVESYDSSLRADAVDLDETSRQYLAFHLEREEYALDICSISEIIKVREFTDVPRTPGFILGIISLRGVVVPVFDLMARLRLGEAKITGSTRIVICQEGDLVVGLLVDSISQVIRIEDDRIEPPPAVLSGLDRDFMKGVGRYQGRMLILLNIDKVLDVELT